MELYPRIGKNFDIKVFTNCRFGMMSWAVLAVTYCIKQVMPPELRAQWLFLMETRSLLVIIIADFILSEKAMIYLWWQLYVLPMQYETYGKLSDSMLVNTILMLVYVTKFFWWEAGYWNTMDIAHDRGLFLHFHYIILIVLQVSSWLVIVVSISEYLSMHFQLAFTSVGDVWYGSHLYIHLLACTL